jgi:hypothetical protein
VKFVKRAKRFSVACTATAPPAGASCQVRIITASGVVATVRGPLLGSEARIYVSATKTLKKKLKKAATIRIALDLVDATGAPIASAPRQKIDNPFN